MSDDAKAMSDWVTAVSRELGIDVQGETVVDTILDMTSDVAHGVSRPAAPLTAYLIGIAAGRADDPYVATADFSRKISALAQGWDADTERGVAANDQSRRA